MNAEDLEKEGSATGGAKKTGGATGGAKKTGGATGGAKKTGGATGGAKKSAPGASGSNKTNETAGNNNKNTPITKSATGAAIGVTAAKSATGSTGSTGTAGSRTGSSAAKKEMAVKKSDCYNADRHEKSLNRLINMEPCTIDATHNHGKEAYEKMEVVHTSTGGSTGTTGSTGATGSVSKKRSV
jgi:hypothetical protein